MPTGGTGTGRVRRKIAAGPLRGGSSRTPLFLRLPKFRQYEERAGMSRQPSDADDVDEIAESVKVVGITGVESETVRVSGGGDEEVGDAPSV
jgi:hypothetical protein